MLAVSNIMGIGLYFILLLLICSNVVADSWIPAKLEAQISQNGRYVVRITPGDSLGDVYGFAGSKKGKYAKAEYYKYTDEGYEKFREFNLVNPVAPLFIAIKKNSSRTKLTY